MAVMFDSALTAALATALHSEWAGRRLEAAWFDSDTWSVRLDFDRERVTWSVHPGQGFLRRETGSADRASRGKRGILSAPARIDRVEVSPDTRRLALVFDSDRSLVFELAANRRNALYVASGRVRQVLRQGRSSGPRAGDEWSPRESDRLWTTVIPTLEEWLAALRGQVEDAIGLVAFLSRLNRDFVFPDGTETELGEAYGRYLELRQAIGADSPAGWMIGDASASQPYPLPLGTDDAVRSSSLVDALSACLGAGEPEGDLEATAIRRALEEKRQRASRKLRSMRVQLEEGSRAAELRDHGSLLLARKAQVRNGLAEVRLEDFSGNQVTVRLDPRLDAVGNADEYFRRARRLDRATRELPPRIEEVRGRVETLDRALESLETDGPSENLRELAGLEREDREGKARGPAADGVRLPYRVYRTSSGLEIRAGRSARDNDALTFKHSSSNDIWMHVRESPGSHVVLRWDDRGQNPPPRDLEEAAVVAAVLSRARGSGLVPVSWTRRKYVRKPRKAGPGSVVTQQTKTIFVEPDEKLVSRLADTD